MLNNVVDVFLIFQCLKNIEKLKTHIRWFQKIWKKSPKSRKTSYSDNAVAGFWWSCRCRHQF